MVEHTRRSVLRTAALAATGAGLAGPLIAEPAAAATTECLPPFGPALVGPDDPRYQELVLRGYNRRYVANPDQIRVVGTTGQVVDAVQEAVKTGKRVTVRSGGHCFEGFVDDEVRLLIDMSGMTGVSFDAARNAFVVEAGAPLGEVYRRLYLGWGVTIPAGYCPKVGAGGHVPGGGYGPLSRLHGLAADHLYAVEVVYVDAAGTARSVIATRNATDPNRELWWAHTGAGGGNFGVATRYWFRSPGATGTNPARLLPAPPATTVTFSVSWPWSGLDEASFSNLARNYSHWCAQNSAPGAATAKLYSELYFYRPEAGVASMVGQVAGDPDAERVLDAHIAALSAGVGVTPTRTQQRVPWLGQAMVGPGEAPKFRLKVKAAFHRQEISDRQIAVAYRHLTRTDYGNPIAAVGMHTYGCQINAMAAGATATAQRDAITKLSYLVGWSDPAQDAQHLAWIREFYREMYAETGGVPVPGSSTDGAYINYPDSDLADPAWNTSGTPWSTLYFKDGYLRLQKVKARFDPRNVFRHALSVRTTA
ncbi:FAD-binding oxidoreductase [Actinoplanes sp. NPDC026619]|uniref:FAD-binding oxidoreductase n=1 Tax=Actinoplanes sp. NPDC026619 TaxID=3155798 RepID=UPI00340D3976